MYLQGKIMKFSFITFILITVFSISACEKQAQSSRIVTVSETPDQKQYNELYNKIYKSCLKNFKEFNSSSGKNFSAKGLDEFCTCLTPKQIDLGLSKNLNSETLELEGEYCRVQVLK